MPSRPLPFLSCSPSPLVCSGAALSVPGPGAAVAVHRGLGAPAPGWAPHSLVRLPPAPSVCSVAPFSFRPESPLPWVPLQLCLCLPSPVCRAAPSNPGCGGPAGASCGAALVLARSPALTGGSPPTSSRSCIWRWLHQGVIRVQGPHSCEVCSPAVSGVTQLCDCPHSQCKLVFWEGHPIRLSCPLPLILAVSPEAPSAWSPPVCFLSLCFCLSGGLT